MDDIERNPYRQTILLAYRIFSNGAKKNPMTITEKIFKWLAKGISTNVIQDVWETETAGGRVYVQHTNKLASFKDQPSKSVLNLFQALELANWRNMGTEKENYFLNRKYVTVEREIEVRVHRDKGDLYGVFEKINETRIEKLTEILTADDIQQQDVKGMHENLNGWIAELRSYLEPYYFAEQATNSDTMLINLPRLHTLYLDLEAAVLGLRRLIK